MFKTIIALTIALVVLAAVAADAQDGCANFGSIAACAAATAKNPPTLCVWSDEAGCIADGCGQLSDNMTCGKQRGCIWMGWQSGNSALRCFSAALLCSAIPYTECSKYSYCTQRDQSYCAVVGILGQNTVTAECDVNFPKWSIALMFVWLIIMIILGIIVALAMGKAKQGKSMELEHETDVVVDAVQIRDNFQLGDPLNQGTDE